MTEGWLKLKSLQDLNYARPIPQRRVEKAVTDLSSLNQATVDELVLLLRSKNKGSVATGLASGWRTSEEALAKDYFSVNAMSYRRTTTEQQDNLAWKRLAVLTHISWALSDELLKRIKELPTASVMNAGSSTNPKAFIKAHRHMTLATLVSAQKSVQHEFEMLRVALRAELGQPMDGAFVAFCGHWVFDAETLPAQILFGYQPTGTDGIINSGPAKSPVVAGLVSRAFLESVIFNIDFKTSLSGAKKVQAARWDEAVDVLLRDAMLTELEVMWIKSMYEGLSLSVHSGAMLSGGEVWFLNSLIRTLRDRMAERRRESGKS